MPAAAVIPAPIGYIKVVAVKKLVVEFLVGFLLCVFLVMQIAKEHATRHIVDSLVFNFGLL